MMGSDTQHTDNIFYGNMDALEPKRYSTMCRLAIRDRFSSPNGVYTGYRPNRL